MTTILPPGEELRKAVQWISEERAGRPEARLAKLVEEASLRFDLSPADGEFLLKFFKGRPLGAPLPDSPTR
jgi:hypothetical protein